MDKPYLLVSVLFVQMTAIYYVMCFTGGPAIMASHYNVCESMMPEHFGTKETKNNNACNITLEIVEAETNMAKTSVKGKLHCGITIKGVFIQVRIPRGNITGTFKAIPNNMKRTRLMKCYSLGDVIGHTGKMSKKNSQPYEIEFGWIGETPIVSRTVSVKATVVHNLTTFYRISKAFENTYNPTNENIKAENMDIHGAGNSLI